MRRYFLSHLLLFVCWCFGARAQAIDPGGSETLPQQSAGAIDFALNDDIFPALVRENATDKTNKAAVSVEALADQTARLRIGFVNFRRIMLAIGQLGAIRTELDREFAQQKQDLVLAQRMLATMERQAAKLSGKQDYAGIEKKLIAKRREVSRMDAALRDNYSVRRNEELSKLQRKVLDQILYIAKARGYDVILNDTGVIYVSPRADLTALVIERFNQVAENKKHDQTETSDDEAPY